MIFGQQKNSNSVLGVKEKTLYLEVFAFNKLLRDFKKIKWCSAQSTPKDTSFHSKSKLNNLSEDSQILHKFLIFGSRCKLFGEVWSLSSLEVILPSKCPSKLKLSQVLIKLG
jgi:hypothetical protein